MRQLSRLGIGVILASALAVLFAAPALAGGWAVVTFDRVPQDLRAGQALTLGFMVRQHGVTPIDSPYGTGAAMQPILTATNAQTGARYQALARKEGPVGHFVVDATFPGDGAWKWEIAPAPFEATQLGTITILPAGGAPQSSAPASRAGLPTVDAATARVALRWAGIGLLVAALGLALWNQRGAPIRRRAGGVAAGVED